jgi:hypothetical protein
MQTELLSLLFQARIVKTVLFAAFRARRRLE